MYKASVGIMRNKVETLKEDLKTQPFIAGEVFEAIQRVIENKNTEMVRTRFGIFTVQYSEKGCLTDNLLAGWLPVYVVRSLSWTSGGITEDEMKGYLESQDVSQ